MSSAPASGLQYRKTVAGARLGTTLSNIYEYLYFVAGLRLTYKRRPRDVCLFVKRWRRIQRAGPFRVASCRGPLLTDGLFGFSCCGFFLVHPSFDIASHCFSPCLPTDKISEGNLGFPGAIKDRSGDQCGMNMEAIWETTVVICFLF